MFQTDLESNLATNGEPENYEETVNDIFNLKVLSLPFLQQEILGIGVSSQFIIVSNKKNEVYRWILSDDSSLKQPYNIPLQERERGFSSKFFCDQRGNHTILKHNSKNYFYFNIKSNKIKEIYKFKEINVESIGWDETANDASTNLILVGTSMGRIYGYQIDYDAKSDSIKERLTEPLIQLKTETIIYGLSFEAYTDKNVCYVLAVTENQFYQFLGSPNFELLFKKYKDKKTLEASCKNFPTQGEISRSMLQMLYKKNSISSFGWLTNAGFCYGSYGLEAYDKLVRNFMIVPFAKLKKDGSIDFDEPPISVAHSEYHIYFLFSDCISIISKITSNIVHTEYTHERINNMYYDKSKNCLWLHSNKNLLQLSIDNEDRDVWKAHLEKEDYEQALAHCKLKNLSAYTKRVAKLYAGHLYDKGDYINAAVRYGESDEKFEEVALKFLIKNKYDALKIYLNFIDSQLPQSASTQRTLIATWLTEIYLHELNNTKNSSNFRTLSENFKIFLKEKLDSLDKLTIYQLLQHYGRVQEFLDFAELKNDYETVILHYINEKNFPKAIKRLHEFLNNNKSDSRKDQKEIKETENMLYTIFTKYSHIFMKFQPELTIELLLNYFKNSIDPNKIISAIMNTDSSKREKVSEYLEDLIKSKVKDKNIHNLFVFFLSQINSEKSVKKLLYYLQLAIEEKEVYFEVDYALKVFSQFKIYSAQAWVLAIMNRHDEAVKVALENNYLFIAKRVAKQVEDPKQKKLLWLEIFKDQIKETSKRGDNFNFALEIIRESEILKIEDILPNLMGNIKIEVFKEEITGCINTYENSILNLKQEIANYNHTAENVKADIQKVKKKCMELRYQQCICEICNNTVKEDNIFLFPCGHIFDAECIYEQLNSYALTLVNLQEKIAILKMLRAEIEDMEKRKNASNIGDINERDGRGTFFTFMGFKGNSETPVRSTSKRISISTDELKKLEEMKIQFYDLLTEECVLCGDYMIETIKEPFVSKSDRDSWMVI